MKTIDRLFNIALSLGLKETQSPSVTREAVAVTPNGKVLLYHQTYSDGTSHVQLDWVADKNGPKAGDFDLIPINVTDEADSECLHPKYFSNVLRSILAR